MTKVFEKSIIGKIKLNNKIIRSATHEGMADKEGFPTDKLKNLYIKLAKGGVGAIITGYTGVLANGKASLVGMTMIDDNKYIPKFQEVTEAVHEHNTPIILQLAHCGRQTRSVSTGYPIVAPSAIRDKLYNDTIPLELTDSGINEIIDAFVSSIVRAKKSNFDGVQLHLAHGYLLAQFLSSYTNRRKDKWGGSTENKFRIIKEIFQRARNLVGDYPILVKMNAYDSRKNGMRIEESMEIAKMLEKSDCTAIEVSCGVFEDGLYTIRGKNFPTKALMEYNYKFKNLPKALKIVTSPIVKRVSKSPKQLLNFNLDSAIKIKDIVSIPVIVVGGINNINDVKMIIDKHKIDFVSMSRAFIIEANIVNKFKENKQESSKCIMCNYCAIIGEERAIKCHYGKLPKKKKLV